MNLFLNELGALASRAGISMLLQTAILVLALALIELTLGRRIGAAWRCALWLLVVAKLLLPPSFSLPTGVGYWLGPWLVGPVKVAERTSTVVTTELSDPIGEDPFAEFAENPPSLPISVSPPRLGFLGGVVVVWLAGSAVLAIWALRRNHEIHRMVRESKPAPAEFEQILRDTAAPLELRRLPKLRLTDIDHSPAVCGLMSPVIVLPATLAQKLSSTSLRDVLLHELIHVQRRDLWLNLPQAIAQVVWWWNPLVWLANARIRTLREQAVDERVMLDCGGDPATYPATLVEVARHCASRPTLALSFVGILESRRALRARVERLLNSSLPQRANLGWAGWLTVTLAALLMLPMAFARRVEVLTPPGEAGILVQAEPCLEVQTAEPRFRLQGQPVADADLEAKLREVAALSPDATLKVQSELTNSADWFGRVIKAASAAGFRRLHLEPLGKNSEGDIQSNISGYVILDPQPAGGAAKRYGFVSHPDSNSPSPGTMLPMDPVLARRYGLVPRPNTDANTAPGSLPVRMEPELARRYGIILPASTNTADSPTHYPMDPALARRYGLIPPTNNAPMPRPTNYYRLDPALARRYGLIVNNPPESIPSTNPAAVPGASTGRQRILDKLNSIVLPELNVDGRTLVEIVQFLDEQARTLDPEHKGLNFIITEPTGSDKSSLDSNAGNAPPNLDQVRIHFGLPLANVRFSDALDAVVRTATSPIEYRVEDYAVVFAAQQARAPQLYTRTFRVDTPTFLLGLEAATGTEVDSNGTGETSNRAAAIQPIVREFLRAAGVNFSTNSPPSGAGADTPAANERAMFFSDRKGILFVRATLEELDIIEKAIAAINVAPPQVMIEAKFFEVDQDTDVNLLLQQSQIDTAARTLSGSLSPAQAQSVLHALEQQLGKAPIAAPKITTVGGRQARISMTKEFSHVDPGSGERQHFLVGPELDVFPQVLPQNQLIHLDMVARINQMLSDPAAGAEEPIVSKREWNTAASIPDGHTVLLGGELSPGAGRNSENGKIKHLLIFVTPTIIDPAGNRVNSDDNPIGK